MEDCLAQCMQPMHVPMDRVSVDTTGKGHLRRSYPGPRLASHLRTLHPRSDSGWNTVTILTPILVGLGVTTLFSAIFLYFYRKLLPAERRNISWMNGTIRPIRWLGRLRAKPRVRAENRSSTWSIDEESAGHLQRLPSAHEPSSSAGHYHNTSPSWLSNSISSVRSAIPAPWKKKPVSVKSVPAERGFQIDDVNQAASMQPPVSPSAGTSEDERSLSDQQWKYLPQTPSPSEEHRRISATPSHAGPNSKSDEGSDIGSASHPQGEHTSLMSASSPMGGHQDDVLLISRSGNDFSVESEASCEGESVHRRS
ncbi:hypothetical protein HGRIS_003049 [Hohenbuehelia grisea]|uniref:Uncharacterized protein n=1 Tax=Hohenbuehelia grisea TaxID=104357 RepID=A0ABR3JN59_9AGAR